MNRIILPTLVLSLLVATATCGAAVAIPAITLHRGQAAHAAVFLEPPPLEKHHLAGRFVQTSQQAAQHNHIRPRDDSLDDIPTVFHPTIRDGWNTILARQAGTFINGRYLWHTRSGYHPRCADGACTNADFDPIGPGFNKSLNPFGGNNITRNDGQVRPVMMYALNRPDDPC